MSKMELLTELARLQVRLLAEYNECQNVHAKIAADKIGEAIIDILLTE